MARLPNPGGDDGQWGSILNDFLAQALDTTSGLLKTDTVGTAQIQDGSVTVSKLSASSPASGQVLSYNGSALGWSTLSGSGSVSDADGSTKGLVQLAGDLAGTAAAPSVAKVKGITVSGTAPTTGQVLTATSASAAAWSTPTGAVTSVNSQTGAVTLTKSDLSLGNVDNTSDTTKNAATATLTNKTISGASNTISNIAESSVTNLVSDLAAKATDSAVVHIAGTETISGTKTFSAVVTVPTPTAPGHATTKAYVDSAASAGAPDASTSVKGIVQLTGALGGTATAPTTPTAVHLTGAETVAGVKTFTSSPIVPLTPTGSTEAASKGYVDTQISGVSGGGGNGGRTVTAAKTSAYTPAAGEYVIVNPTAGGFTVTMPTGQASGTWISLKNIGTNSNAVLIVPGAGASIEDAGNYSGLSVSLNSGQTCMDFIYDGTSKWYRVG